MNVMSSAFSCRRKYPLTKATVCDKPALGASMVSVHSKLSLLEQCQGMSFMIMQEAIT